jgi:hypothetical protein
MLLQCRTVPKDVVHKDQNKLAQELAEDCVHDVLKKWLERLLDQTTSLKTHTNHDECERLSCARPLLVIRI